MKRRWAWLFTAALLTMVGAMWMGQRSGAGLYIGRETIGMMLATFLAFMALVCGARSKWFAAGVLLCSVPALVTVIIVFDEDNIRELTASLGYPFLLIVAGVLSTVVAGFWILFAPVPPPPIDDPIARARVVD